MFEIKIYDFNLAIKIFFIKLKFGLHRFLRIISLIDFLLPKKKKRICFCVSHEHISVCSKYYNYLKEKHKDEYELLVLISDKNYCNKFDNSYYFLNPIGILKAMTSKIVIAGTAVELIDIFSSKRHIYLYFNHGMPVKAIGFAIPNRTKSIERRYKFIGDNAKLFVTSDVFKNLTISCTKATFKNVYVTGTPRNDLIGSTKNDDKIKKLFNIEKYNKIVLYMPTYMKREHCNDSQAGKEFNNIFYLDDYNKDDFIKTIEENNILFIMKPHPWEEYFYKKNPDVVPKSENFKIVYNEDFYKNDIEQYELFKFIDCMISDYSSSPIDFLLLNKPVIYMNALAEGYSKSRGMTLEDNYEILMPGIKITKYAEFMPALLDALSKDSYKQERERLLPLIHKYRDFNSCERIYNIMKDLK